MSITSNKELLERIKKGVKSGVEKALAQHKKSGNSIVVWKDGKIQQISADKIQVSKV